MSARSVPFGKCCLSNRLVFSLKPSCHGLLGSQKYVLGILSLIAEFENDIRHERQMDGIAKAKEKGIKFGRKALLTPETVEEIRDLRIVGITVPKSFEGQVSRMLRFTGRWPRNFRSALPRECGHASDGSGVI
jgi:hypothetical protein